MKCPYCNEDLPEGSCFCSNCGSRVDSGSMGSSGGNPAGGGMNAVPFYQIPQNQPSPVMPQGGAKKGKGKWIAAGVVAAVAVTGCVAAAAVMLTAKTPKEKVIAAFERTFDSKEEFPIEKVFGLSQMAKMVKSQDVEEGIGLTLSGTSVYGTQDFVGSGFDMGIKNSFSARKTSVDLGVSYNGMKIADANIYYGDNRLMAAVPQVSSYAFLLDMGGDFGARLDGSPAIGPLLRSEGVDSDELASLVTETMDKAYDTENRPFDFAALLNRYKEGCKAKDKFKEALTVEKNKGDTKNFTVSGKEQKCQGYTMAVSKDAMVDFLDESSGFFLEDEVLRDDFMEYLKLAARISEMTGDVFAQEDYEDILDEAYGDIKDGADELIRILDKSLDDVEMVVYLDRKGNLAAFSGETSIDTGDEPVGVEFEVNLKGGDHPLQNLEAAVELSCDGERITADIERTGDVSDKELADKISVDMNVTGDRAGIEYAMSYGKADGNLEIQLDVSSERLQVASLSLEANVDELEKGKSIHMDIDELRIEEHISGQYMAFEGEFYLKPLEGEIEEPSGQVFDVLEADEQDWYNLGNEIEEKAESAFGDLF